MAVGGIPLNLHFSRHWAQTEAHPAQQEASLCCAGALHEGPEAVGSPCWRSSVPPGLRLGAVFWMALLKQRGIRKASSFSTVQRQVS